eukprot:TRINITY_DN16346_c0_g1_i1.p2 TRINITY_DN16346_c0_g1~~TRINITY_DN16346_c0_g1_i1.p2  ORF type:complete len:128 (+),score=36.87 TRINITY_DN16346_c0_g1_i1:38-385(+)
MGFSPLQFACSKSTFAIFYLLFENVEIDIDSVNHGGDSLLHRAVSNSDVEIINFLISMDCDLNKKNHEGNSPLMIAFVDNKNLNVIKHLVDSKIDINKKDEVGNTLFFLFLHEKP